MRDRCWNKDIESANKMTLELILGNINFRRMIISYLINTGISKRI